MALIIVPKKKMVLGCDFTKFEAPEITKNRPIVVMSVSPARPNLCVVIPLSTTPPHEIHPWHHPLSRASSWDRQKRWAKCDMIYTVAFNRLDRWKLGKDKHGKRHYLSDFYVSDQDFDAMQLCIAEVLGL